MLVNNRLTKPGEIRRIDLTPDNIRITMRDGTERVYTGNRTREINQADYNALDAVADMRRDSQ